MKKVAMLMNNWNSRREDQKFKVNFDFIASLKPTLLLMVVLLMC